MRVAFVCLHTSPAERAGTADAGGMNVVEVNTAIALAARGHRVDMLTRRDDPSTPSSFVEDDAHPQRHAGQWRTHLPESAPSNGNDAGYADPVAR